MVVLVVLFGVHGIVVLVLVVKVVVGVVGQVAKADGDDGGDMGVNFFGTPVTTNSNVRRRIIPPSRHHRAVQRASPPDERLESLDAVLPQLIVVHVTELDHQGDDLLQVLSCKQTGQQSDTHKTTTSRVSAAASRLTDAVSRLSADGRRALDVCPGGRHVVVPAQLCQQVLD